MTNAWVCLKVYIDCLQHKEQLRIISENDVHVVCYIHSRNNYNCRKRLHIVRYFVTYVKCITSEALSYIVTRISRLPLKIMFHFNISSSANN